MFDKLAVHNRSIRLMKHLTMWNLVSQELSRAPHTKYVLERVTLMHFIKKKVGIMTIIQTAFTKLNNSVLGSNPNEQTKHTACQKANSEGFFCLPGKMPRDCELPLLKH